MRRLGAHVSALMPRWPATDLTVFESHRALLVALAYRMLGDLGRAEDMVQEAWLRWQSRREEADSPDLARMEDVLRDSGLDWTVVRPPRLTDQALTGSYRTARGQNLRRGVLISRADVAHLMLHVLEQPQTIREAIGIAY